MGLNYVDEASGYMTLMGAFESAMTTKWPIEPDN